MNENQTSRQEQAQNLYLNSGLNQAQIAESVGVSPKTISLWVRDGEWQLLREKYKQTPLYLISQMNDEILLMCEIIAKRPKGEQIPTINEVETRHKIIATIKAMKERQTYGARVETIIELYNYMRIQDPEAARLFIQYADDFANAKYAAEKKNESQPILQDELSEQL